MEIWRINRLTQIMRGSFGAISTQNSRSKILRPQRKQPMSFTMFKAVHRKLAPIKRELTGMMQAGIGLTFFQFFIMSIRTTPIGFSNNIEMIFWSLIFLICILVLGVLINE